MTSAFQSGAFQDDAFQIDAAPSTNYTLTCQTGSYTVSGQSAVLLRSKSITAQAGSYAETGVNATLKVDKKLTAQPGAYDVTGQDATITRTGGVVGYTLTAQAGSYLIGADYWNDGYAEPGYAGNAIITIGQRPRGASKAKIAPKKTPQRRIDDDEVYEIIMALVSAEYI